MSDEMNDYYTLRAAASMSEPETRLASATTVPPKEPPMIELRALLTLEEAVKLLAFVGACPCGIFGSLWEALDHNKDIKGAYKRMGSPRVERITWGSDPASDGV